MNSVDITGIDEMDPSLSDGFKIVYDKEVPIELRLQDPDTGPQEVGDLKSIKIKILTLGDFKAPGSFKIELTSEEDLFFNYICIVDENNYVKIKQEQNLNIDFPGYLNSIIKIFNNCQKDPQKQLFFKYFLLFFRFFSVLFMQKDGYARLDFIENIEYKFLELFSIEFNAANEETIRQNITFRYNCIKAKFLLVENKLKDVNALIKLKNPSLLIQLQKNINNQSSITSTSKIFK